MSPVARLSTLAAAALVGSGLVLAAPPAHAAPVFTASNFDSSGFAHDDAACTTSNQVEPVDVDDVAVVENGAATSLSTASSVTLTAADPTDVMTGSASTTGSGSVSSTGTTLKSIDHTSTGSVAITSTKPVSACDLHMYATTNLDFTFVVTTPGFLTIDIARKGPVYTEFYLEMDAPDDSAYYDQYNSGFDFHSSQRLYLPAGTYSGYSNIAYGVDDRSTAFAGAPSAGIHATFALAGSQSQAVQGKAKKYVTFPAARSCATHSVNMTITSKKKRADKIKQVKFYVNDKLVKKAKTPDRSDAFNLPVADDVDADVRAVVKLFPKKKGKPAKVYEASAGYVACSS